jgi:hypothetical protein
MAKKKAAEIAAENEGQRGKVNQILDIQDGATALAAAHGVALPNINSLVQFREHVKTKCRNLGLDQTKPNDVHKAGAIIIQEITVRMLEEYSNKQELKTLDEKRSYTQRLSYFSSDDFIKNFTVKFPTRDDGDETAVGNSYTRWFNDLFKVGFSDWRPGYLSKLKDPAQCKTAMGYTQTTDTGYFQNGKIPCYLCGLMMDTGPGISTIQCEHILPVVSALSHWWLIKKATYTDEELLWLQMEYAWSHECCNMMKSNYDFLYYNPATQKYDVNYDVIKSVLDTIQKGRPKLKDPTKSTPGKKYDCGAIPGLGRINIETRTQDIARTKIKPIVNVVNRNVNTLGGYQLYLLFIKFKVLSAMTSEDFLTALMGEEEGVAIANQAKAEKIRAAAEAAAEETAAREEKIRAAALAREQRIQDSLNAARKRGAPATRRTTASTPMVMTGGNPLEESGLYILENKTIVGEFIDKLDAAAGNPTKELDDPLVPYDPESISFEDEPDSWNFPPTFLKYIRENLPDNTLTDEEVIREGLPYVLFHWDKTEAENVQDIDDAVNSILKTAQIVKKLKELEESIVAAETAALRILEAKALGKIPIQGVSYRPTAQLGKTNPFSNIRKGTQIPKERNTGTMRRNRLRLTPLVSAKYRQQPQIIQQPRSVRAGRRTRKLKKRL